MAKFPLLGVNISAMRFDEAVQRLLAAPAAGERLRVHFCTAHTLVEASEDRVLRERLNESEIVSPDGMPLVWVGRLRGQTIERVYGPDMMLALADRSREAGLRHYFYGGAEGVPERLAQQLRQRFPGMQVAGAYSPPFRPLSADEEADVVQMINTTHPDFVWVGLGSPKQDHWVSEFRGRLDASALLAVGAAFDFHSGGTRESPRWVRQAGLQWFDRLLHEPRRLWRRYTVTNARFLWLLARDVVRGGVRAP